MSTVEQLQARLTALSASFEAMQRRVYDAEEELRHFRMLGAKFVAVAGKNTESPAYISDEFATFLEAEKDLVAAGYPIGHVEIYLKVENVRQGYLVIDRGGMWS